MKKFLRNLCAWILAQNKNTTKSAPIKKSITYLNVPYADKDIIKSLGAKWDYVQKKWFISDDLDRNLFEKWFIDEFDQNKNSDQSDALEQGNLKAQHFYLAQTYRSCYQCDKNIQVNAIVLPEGFESIDEQAIEELDEKGGFMEKIPFCCQDYCTLVSYLTYICPKALIAIYKHVDPNLFKKKYSQFVQYSYYRSICPYCKAAQGDNYTINDYDSAFSPVKIDDFSKIKFLKIDQKIQVRAGCYSIDYPVFNEQVLQINDPYFCGFMIRNIVK